MTPLTDEEVEDKCTEAGVDLDYGNRIDGPFIPDGTCRILDPSDHWTVLGQGDTAAAAWDDYKGGRD